MKTWCVAKPSSDQAALLDNINYACSHVDCRVLSSGCPCYSPGNLINHASVAMNLYYQANGRNYWNCNFKNSGLIVITNPSEWMSMLLHLFLLLLSKTNIIENVKTKIFVPPPPPYFQAMETATMTTNERKS